MKDRRLIAIATVVLIGMGFGVYWLIEPCQPFARLFANIACPQFTIKLFDFRPIDGQAISPPDADGAASIYGWVGNREAEDLSAGWIRFNLETGEEISRAHLPFLNGNRWHMGFSKDGERAAITCFDNEPCSQDGWQRAIIPVKGTTSVEPLEAQAIRNDPLSFPGDTQPNAAPSEAARFAASGQRVVFIDAKGAVSLQDADGQPIKVLFDTPRPGRAFAFLNALSVSPSGAYVALLDASHSIPSLLIWDTWTGNLLARVNLPPRPYAIDIDPTWSRDENQIGIVRHQNEAPDMRDSALDIYTWR